MKKMSLFLICLVLIAGIASAQTRNSRRRGPAINATATSSSTVNQINEVSTQPKSDNRRQSTQTLIRVIPDNRKEFMQDGQLATYTGHQATAINTDEFQSGKKDETKNDGKNNEKE